MYRAHRDTHFWFPEILSADLSFLRYEQFYAATSRIQLSQTSKQNYQFTVYEICYTKQSFFKPWMFFRETIIFSPLILMNPFKRHILVPWHYIVYRFWDMSDKTEFPQIIIFSNLLLINSCTEHVLIHILAPTNFVVRFTIFEIWTILCYHTKNSVASNF